jgi:hypothetical protein
MNITDSVVERMEALIASWEQAGDTRLIFLSCYALMTRNMLAAIQENQFEDNRWVLKLLHHFAQYYFNALDTYERKQVSAPVVWQIAFNASLRPETHVLQLLSLGVNAHINFDLVFAVADLLEPEWVNLSPDQRQIRYRDFIHVNEIIAQTIDKVQDTVIERQDASMDLIDRILGPLDEWLVSRVISSWREQVWESSACLVQTQNADERAELRQEVEQRSLSWARSILGEQGVAGLLRLF